MADKRGRPLWEMLVLANDPIAAIYASRKLVRDRIRVAKRHNPGLDVDEAKAITTMLLPAVFKKVKPERRRTDDWLRMVIDSIISSYVKDPSKYRP